MVRLQVALAARLQVVVARRQRQHKLIQLQNVGRRVLVVGADEQLHQHRFAEFTAQPAQQRFDAERGRLPVGLGDRPAAQLGDDASERCIAARAYLNCMECVEVCNWLVTYYLDGGR